MGIVISFLSIALFVLYSLIPAFVMSFSKKKLMKKVRLGISTLLVQTAIISMLVYFTQKNDPYYGEQIAVFTLGLSISLAISLVGIGVVILPNRKK